MWKIPHSDYSIENDHHQQQHNGWCWLMKSISKWLPTNCQRKKWYFPRITEIKVPNTAPIYFQLLSFDRVVIHWSFLYQVIHFVSLRLTNLDLLDLVRTPLQDTTLWSYDGPAEKEGGCLRCRVNTKFRCIKCNVRLHHKCFIDFHSNKLSKTKFLY